MTPVSIRNIQQLVALDTRISIKKMISPAADQPIVDARNAAMWLAQQIDYTLPEIGRTFGDRDEATVQNAIDDINRRMASDPGLAALVHRYDYVVTEREPPGGITTDKATATSFYSIDSIQSTVAWKSRISIRKMVSRDTDESVVRARNVAMWLARQIDCDLPEIGRAFGNRDEATVHDAIATVDRTIATDPKLTALLRRCGAMVTE